MPTHHNLDRYLKEYIAAAGISQDRKGPLFRTSKGRGSELADRPMLQSDVWRMIRRRAAQAGIETEIGCHTFRATGITAYLKNGGRLEIAQQMAAHESARTTGLYDRRSDEVSLDEVERIGIQSDWSWIAQCQRARLLSRLPPTDNFDNATNEMVRRLILLFFRRIVEAAFQGGSSLCRYSPLASTWGRRRLTLWHSEQPASCW